MDANHGMTRRLHEEHVAVLALLRRLAGLIATARGTPPDSADGAVAGLLGDLKRAIEGEVTEHFDFEEETVFPLLDAAGDGDLGELLTGEHEVIRPLGQEVARRAGAALADGFDQAAWDIFRRQGSELVERLCAHVDKEELALVPALEDILDRSGQAQRSA